MAQLPDDPRAGAAEAFAAVRALISLGEALIREGLDLRINQLVQTDVGATTRAGPSAPRATSRASVWIVLPRPMSSARQAPAPQWARRESHANPSA